MNDKTPHSSIERIGIDESGKGDYFGPLVIAAVFVNATTQGELNLMNVRDSKKISDGRILEMAPDIPPQPSLIEYPSAFPIKVMGANAEGFEAAVVAIAEHFDPTFDRGTVERRESRGGHYLGITIVVTATSREQLDELYRTLTTHPLVKVVL